MKKASLFIGAALVLVSCGSEVEVPEVGELTTEETSEAEAIVYNIDPANSSIKWTGSMMGLYDHFGGLQISEGTITVEDGMIVSGMVTVDMNTMTPEDENYSEDKPAEGLVGHLMSPDFFDVATYPTATFEITGTDGQNVVGNMTIRGVTNEGVITISSSEMTDDGMTASGTMTFDRHAYGVSYKTGAADMVISDMIELELSVSASKVVQ